MPNARALRLDTVSTPPPSRGRLLYVSDVQALLGTMPDGKVRSRTWIYEHVAKEQRMKFGRYPCWWEEDVMAWLDSHRESAA